MRAVDVGATVGADGVVIKLPRLCVQVERRQAERLRDLLNTVLPPVQWRARRMLLNVPEGAEPSVMECSDEQDRIEAAQDCRRAHGTDDVLVKLDLDVTGRVTASNLSGEELTS